MEYKNYTLKEFTQVLSDATPTPGGGGASALSAAIGIALGGMVASLTSINDKYKDVHEDMMKLLNRCSALQERFLELIDADAKAYEPLSRAYKMPRQTSKEIEERTEAIQNSLVLACLTPIDIMESCCEAINILEELSKKGSKMVLSDVGAGIMLMRSALNTASINVFINLRSMNDENREKQIRSKTDHLLDIYTKKADAIYDDVLKKIS